MKIAYLEFPSNRPGGNELIRICGVLCIQYLSYIRHLSLLSLGAISGRFVILIMKYFYRNPIFQNLGLCAACWAHFICHHELWPTPVSHPFFSFNSSLGLAGEKHITRKLLSLDLFFKVMLFRVVFLILICIAIVFILFISFWLFWYCSIWLYFRLGD